MALYFLIIALFVNHGFLLSSTEPKTVLDVVAAYKPVTIETVDKNQELDKEDEEEKEEEIFDEKWVKNQLFWAAVAASFEYIVPYPAWNSDDRYDASHGALWRYKALEDVRKRQPLSQEDRADLGLILGNPEVILRHPGVGKEAQSQLNADDARIAAEEWEKKAIFGTSHATLLLFCLAQQVGSDIAFRCTQNVVDDATGMKVTKHFYPTLFCVYQSLIAHACAGRPLMTGRHVGSCAATDAIYIVTKKLVERMYGKELCCPRFLSAKIRKRFVSEKDIEYGLQCLAKMAIKYGTDHLLDVQDEEQGLPLISLVR